MTRSPALPVLGLVTVTAAWGSTFLLRDVLDRLPADDLLAVRFLLAAAMLTLVAPGAVRRVGRPQWRAGAALGLVHGVA